MIYITGDCHKDFSRFEMEAFLDIGNMTKEDYFIICGDFGGVWFDSKENDTYIDEMDLDFLEDSRFTTLFVDGNNENFDELYKYPVKEWHGGKVHVIRPSVLHLMRGEIYEINGKKFFTFGGAQSHDIRDGIVEKDQQGLWRKMTARWKKEGKFFRVKHYSWWEQELPTKEEIENAYTNLEKHDYKVDYIVTHCCSNQMLREYIEWRFNDSDMAKQHDGRNILTNFLDEIEQKVNFDKWYFGHYHEDVELTNRHHLVYRDMIRIV